MGRVVRQFTTYLDGREVRNWHDWDEDSFVGAVKRGGQPLVDGFRPFDMLTGDEPCQPGQPQLTVFKASDLLVGVEHKSGVDPFWYRSLDHDQFVLQFMGRSRIDTEAGSIELEPGQMAYLPYGVAHRSFGQPGSLRVVCAYHGRLELGIDPERPTTRTRWEVSQTPAATPAWASADGYAVEPLPPGKVWEVMSHWDDPDQYWAVRDEANITGTLTEASLRPRKLLTFDHFAGMTGKGGPQAPVIFSAANLKVDVYNTSGEQWAFHRNLEHDELWFHFAGASHNDTEFGPGEIATGEMALVPHGIGHRTTGSPPPRMLLVIYHNYPVQLGVDPHRHARQTTFSAAPVGAEVAQPV